MNIRELGGFVLRLINHGFVSTDFEIDEEDISNMLLLSRDYIYSQKKVAKSNTYFSSPAPISLPIVDGKVLFENNINASAIKSISLLDCKNNKLSDMVIVMNETQGANTNTFLTYSVVNKDGLQLYNTPDGSDKVSMVVSVSGSLDENVDNEIAWLMVTETLRAYGVIKQIKNDDSTNNKNQANDILYAQFAQQFNSPNNVV